MFGRFGTKCIGVAVGLAALTSVAAAQAGSRYIQKWTGVYDSAVSGQDRAVSVASVVGDAVTLVTSHRVGGAGTLVVYRTTRDGVRQWTTPLDVPGWSYGEDFHGTAKVGGDSDGNVYLAFNARNLTTDRLCPAVAKLNADGSLAWTHLYQDIYDSSVNFEAMSSADFDLSGNVFLTGQSIDTTTGNGGGFAMRVAPDQSVQWKRTYTSATSQIYGKCISRDSRGNAYVGYYAPTATGGTGYIGVYDGAAGTVRFEKQIVCGASTTDLEPNAIENSGQYAFVVGRGKAPDHNFGFATYYLPDGTVKFSKEYKNGSVSGTQRFDSAAITDHYLMAGGSFADNSGVIFFTPAGLYYYAAWGQTKGTFTSLLIDKAETLHAVGHGMTDAGTNEDGIYMRWGLADTGTHGDYPVQRVDPTFIQFGSSGTTAGNDAVYGIALNKYGEVYVAGTIDPAGEYAGSNPPDSASYAFTTDLEQPPVAKPDAYVMDEDSGPQVFSSVLTNDIYASEATFQLVDPYKTGITHFKGTVVMNADGSFTYTPRKDFWGTDSFEYTLKHDGLYPAQHGVVTIRVNSVNDAPVQTKPIVFIDETGSIDRTVYVSGYFTDDENMQDVIVSVVTPPAHGIVYAGNGQTFRYVTNGQYFGHDTFVIKVTDRGKASTQATVDVYTPFISSLSPDSLPVGAPTFTMRVNGKGFAPTEVVYWNSTKLSATWVSDNAIDVVVPASYVATAGSAYVRTTTASNHYSRKFRILTLPNIKVTGTLTTDASGHHAVVTVRNAGQSPSDPISITAARIGTTNTTTPLPISLGSLAGGVRQNVNLDFPTAGTPGTSVLLKVTVQNGSVSKTYSIRVTL